jgi:protocatechuate 3,4-dioxygenase beta subunit
LAPNKYLLRVISDKEGSGNLTVTVEPGQTVRDVRIPLSKGVPFEVMVYNLENGAPLEDATVTVTQTTATPRYTLFNQRVTTDANGLTRLHVPPGECEIRVIKFGHGATFQPQRVQLDPGQTLRHEVSLPRTACTLSGEVLDEQGRVLSDALVMLLPFGLGFHRLTDANGHFEMNYYSSRMPSSARVLARHAPSGLGATAVLRDPTKSGRIHGRIILKPAYVLTGRVTDPTGRSIPAAYVKLLQKRYRNLFTEVATDANGVYSIHSVPPEGDNLKDGYAIAACAEGFGLTQVNQIPFHDDTARPVHMEPIILLPADEVISGVVEDSNDQPLAGALVEVYGPRFSRTVSQPPCGKTLTDAQGRFRITGVCKEPLRIYASSPSPQRLTGQTWANGGNENVKVVLGQKLIFSPSLIGKPLPDLKDLKVDLSPADTDDKMLLVCFWDMQQRPSRNCIMRLAKQAEQLKQKGVAVVAIQASKVNESTLNDWLKEYNIPFTIGIVQSDVEKTKFDWGVRSLPWLILTNRKHIVRAEGFALTEIDEKISAIAQKQN